jgi:NADH dehydrogenase
VPGDGEYRLQPVCVEDLADLAVASGAANEACTVDAVGPEIFTFNELLRLIARAIHRPARLVHLPPGLTLPLAGLIGRWQGDVTLTDQEYHGLSANLLVSAQPPTCPTRLSEWLPAHGERLGLAYASEVARHF